MTTDADRPVEAILQAAFTFDLTADTRRSIDRRVQAAVASDRHHISTGAPRRRLLKLTPRMLAGLAVATLLLATTAVAGGTLLSRLTEGAPILENVWDRATDVGTSVTDVGYTVTLEKAAVDRDRVWVALVVNSDAAAAEVWDMHVTDANGVTLTGGTGAGTGDVHGQTATMFGFRVPDGVTPSGPFVLEVTALGANGEKTPGSWRFTFNAPLTPAWSHAPAAMTPAP